jgi:ankyrin repeat protein
VRRPSKTAVFDAARTWDAASLQAYLVSSPSLVGAVDSQGRSLLHRACAVRPGAAGLRESDGIETVAMLLKAGADLDQAAPVDEDEGDFRATPLWYAIARGENLPLARFLLARGADASTSLWAVVWRDDDETCRELLNSKPRLNLRAHGETPIFYAARLKRLKTLDVLIEAGADPTIADIRGRDTVDIARARRLPRSVIERLDALGRRTTFERQSS